MFTVGTAFSILNLILIPFLSLKLGSSGMAGNMLSAGMLLSVFLGPIIGSWSDRIGKRIPFIGMFLIVMAASCILLPLLNDRIIISIISISFVMCTLSSMVAYSSLVADYSSSEDKDRNYALVMGMVNLSSFVSAFIIGKIFVFSIPMAFFTAALIMSVSFLPALFYVVRHPVRIVEIEDSKGKNMIKDIKDFFKDNRVLIPYYFFIQVGAWFTIGGMWPYITSFLRDELRIPVGIGAQWVGWMSLIIAFFSLFISRISKRGGRMRVYVISLLGLTTCLGVMTLLYDVVLNTDLNFIILMFLMSLFLAFFYALNSSTLSSIVSSKDQGKAFGMSTFFGTLSQAGAVWLFGTVISLYGYRIFFLFTFLGILYATGGGIWLNIAVRRAKG